MYVYYRNKKGVKHGINIAITPAARKMLNEDSSGVGWEGYKDYVANRFLQNGCTVLGIAPFVYAD